MKNPHRRPDHRQAFDLAVKLVEQGQTNYLDIAQQLAPAIPREMRRKIAAKVCRKAGIRPGTAAVSQPGQPETIAGVARPTTDAEAEALARWLQATPAQRLQLLVEMQQLGKLLSGQTAPWKLLRQ